MLYVFCFLLLGIMLFGVCLLGISRQKGSMSRAWVWGLFLSALFLRILAASLSKGFGSDTACFAAWAERIFKTGPAGFYSPDVFTDYPPGYMYIIWITGAVRNVFSIGYYSAAHLVLLKLPAIFCDLACAWLLLKEASGRLSGKQAFFLYAAYLFNPAIVLNSSIWGQVDSVFTLAAAYMCLCLVRRRLPSAYIAFGIGILIKPQMLLFSPVLLAAVLDQVLLNHFSLKNLFHHLFLGLAAAAGTVILCLPFGLENVWNQYFSTLSSYPYAAVNACNLWGLFGLNWVSQDNVFLGIPYRVYGGFAIAAAIALMFFYSLRHRRENEKYPFLGALLLFTIFVFSVRMHERYLYPGLLLLLFSFAYKPKKRLFVLYGAFSSLHFLNTADVLFFYDPSNYDRKAPLILAVSGGMVLCAAFLYYTAFRAAPAVSASRTIPFIQDLSSGQKTLRADGSAPCASRRSMPLKRADLFCMLIITAIYGCFALYDLGDRQAPSTPVDMTQNQTIELDFGTSSPSSLWYYIAPWHKRTFLLEGRENSAEEWHDLGEITLNNVFTWQSLALESHMSQLRFTLQDTQASLLEWVFLDDKSNLLMPNNALAYKNLFDETRLYPRTSPMLDTLLRVYKNMFEEARLYPRTSPLLNAILRCVPSESWSIQLYPEAGSFRNSMYFDEIYHGRTAYEFIHGLTSYENTHPPLGKILIALGISLFGMNPFGWRIMGAFLGIVMVPILYLFAKKISGHTPLAALACMLFAFDFMHFAQTRIATIDVFITFFVLLMYYFMYQYSVISFYDTPLKKTFLPLGACGICMGLGIASKWTGIYAGAGLALIFFSVLFKRYREYLYARKTPEASTEGISHKSIIENFPLYTRQTISFCLIFFVVIPAVIYLLSYLPFRDYADRGLFARMLYNQNTMFSYHSALDATHDFSSPWYQWPVIKRPIWFYSHLVTKTAGGGLREGISSFGNPAVWWAGIPAAFYMIYLWIRKKDRTAAFLTVGYLAQYLPWFFVTRITFIYHYFPSVAFVVLMILHSFSQWKKTSRKKSFYAALILYGAAAFGLFLLFYPVLSGQPVEASFVAKYLRWFEGWVLTSK